MVMAITRHHREGIENVHIYIGAELAIECRDVGDEPL